MHNVAEKEVSRSGQFLNNWFYHHCGLIPVALTPEIRESIMKRYKLPAVMVPVVINGIDTTKFKPKESYERCDERYFTILHIGRFSPQKNHEGLLRAFKVLHRMYPDCRLILVGEGELFPQIRDLIHELDLESCVTLAGTTGDVNTFFQAADMFFLPSLYEGLPMTLLEAMCAGLPVLASNVGGIPYLTLAGKCGALTVLRTDAIISTLHSLYMSKQIREVLGRAGRQRVLDSFSSEVMTTGYLKIYRQEV